MKNIIIAILTLLVSACSPYYYFSRSIPKDVNIDRGSITVVQDKRFSNRLSNYPIKEMRYPTNQEAQQKLDTWLASKSTRNMGKKIILYPEATFRPRRILLSPNLYVTFDHDHLYVLYVYDGLYELYERRATKKDIEFFIYIEKLLGLGSKD